MSKQIWLSPVLGKSRERLVARCSEMISPGESPRFLYLTASHPLLELVTKWILDFETIRGVWGALPVYLFRGFVREILTSSRVAESGKPLTRRTSIDGEDSHLKHSLLSQLMRRLVASGELTALAPLAHRDGTINTISNLIGEFQRAGTTPNDFRRIVETRASDLRPSEEAITTGETDQPSSVPPRQLDFDREIGVIYEAYIRALDEFDLTEEDADQLRALQVLTGRVTSVPVIVPWLDEVQLLVLDGFFDFTPVQGEMLRALIPRVPNVIVNLYGDEQNPEVFDPFADTIKQLHSISEEFEIVQRTDSQLVGPTPARLRARLFNSKVITEQVDEDRPAVEEQLPADPIEGARERSALRIFRCKDRESEVRAIAKEIKRLVLLENFSIRDIALVVRQRAAYAETIARVFADEAVPCTIEHVVALAEVPAVRAILKLFQILAVDGDASNPRVTDLADLIKSGYFRLSSETLRNLRTQLNPMDRVQAPEPDEESIGSESALASFYDPQGFAEWNPDALENVLAYVGSELRLDRWLDRARRLASNDATAKEVREQIFGPDNDDEDNESQNGEEPGEQESEGARSRNPPSREVLPVMLQWSALVLREFAAIIKRATRENGISEPRSGLLKLLEELQFSNAIRERLVDVSLESALPHAALDLRALEGIGSAIAAAQESIEIASKVIGHGDASSLTLSIFVTEIERCIGAQSLRIASADRDGLQVLEATDVRGLRFRAVFIAGLIEGGFPLRKERDWIYPHEERERLKKYGLTLEDISPATLLKEEHYFYQAACRATDALYLSWPLVIGGNETVVSYYLDEVRHALTPLEIATEDVSSDFEGGHLFKSSSQTEVASSIVRLSERQKHRGRQSVLPSESDLAKLFAWAEAHGIISPSARARIEIGRERTGDHFSRYDGLITNANLLGLLTERYGVNYVWSASALSLFGKSPFKFFAERVLKLEPRIEAALDLAAIDAGGLLHEALRRFFARHRAERLFRRDRLRLRDEMRSVAAAVFDEHERAVPPLNVHVWEIDREIYQLQLAQVVDYEISLHEKVNTNGPLPTYFELGFGMARGIRDEKSTSEFLVLERAGPSRAEPETIRLRGQIDRLDVASDGTIIAYDYKSSRGASRADMIEGRDLQIAIYLEAIEKLYFPGHQIAGGGYYLLRSCDRNRGLYRKEFDRYTQIGTRVSSRVEEDEWLGVRAAMHKRIWEFVDAIRSGHFVVNPTAPEQTCGSCEFLPVCRYEKFRILRKR